MADLGFLTAPTVGGREAKRWVWPFAQMEVGDYFRVAPTEKPIHVVRNTANARAYQLNIRLSVRMDEAGNTVVKRVSPTESTRRRRFGQLDYKTASRRVAALYGDPEAFDRVPWQVLRIGQAYPVCAHAREAIAKPDIVMQMVDGHSFHLALHADGFTVTRLADGATAEDLAAIFDLMK